MDMAMHHIGCMAVNPTWFTAPHPERNPNVFQGKSGRRILVARARRNFFPSLPPSVVPSLGARRIFWKVLQILKKLFLVI